jgi:uncharacterized protein (DUF1330 family)
VWQKHPPDAEFLIILASIAAAVGDGPGSLNKGLLGFLIFLGAVVVGLGVVGYLLGPHALSFIFHAERKSAPVVLVDLVDFADAAAEQDYRRGYYRTARTLIDAAGGRRLWSGHPSALAIGRPGDAWNWLELVEYPSRSAVIELVTSSDYRALAELRAASTTRVALLAATPRQPFMADAGGACVVRFVTVSSADSLAAYAANWAADDSAELGRFAGVLAWYATLNPLSTAPAQRWDAMWLYAFPDTASRAAWFTDSRRATQQALERHLFRRDVLLLVEADGSALDNAK